jgi:hypothetical protein
MAIVSYTDERGIEYVQPALVGDNHVHLLNGRELGFSEAVTPSGRAVEWLKTAILEKLKGKK